MIYDKYATTQLAQGIIKQAYVDWRDKNFRTEVEYCITTEYWKFICACAGITTNHSHRFIQRAVKLEEPKGEEWETIKASFKEYFREVRTFIDFPKDTTATTLWDILQDCEIRQITSCGVYIGFIITREKKKATELVALFIDKRHRKNNYASHTLNELRKENGKPIKVYNLNSNKKLLKIFELYCKSENLELAKKKVQVDKKKIDIHIIKEKKRC